MLTSYFVLRSVQEVVVVEFVDLKRSYLNDLMLDMMDTVVARQFDWNVVDKYVPVAIIKKNRKQNEKRNWIRL